MTTTNEDLRHALNRLTSAMVAADLDTSHLHIEHGSKTYGRAYRLYRRDPETGGLGSLPGLSSGFLGTTKGEAVHSLDMMTAALWMVVAADVEANR